MSFIEKASQALEYDKEEMGDYVLAWQMFFCVMGESQEHSWGFVVVGMIETLKQWKTA